MFLDTNVIILILNFELEEKYRFVIDEYIKNKNIYISNIVLGEILGYQGYTNEQASYLGLSRTVMNSYGIVSTDSPYQTSGYSQGIDPIIKKEESNR